MIINLVGTAIMSGLTLTVTAIAIDIQLQFKTNKQIITYYNGPDISTPIRTTNAAHTLIVNIQI